MHRIRVERESGIAVLRPEGELDAFAAPDLDAAFEVAGDTSRLVVDLGSVSFMDSTALGLIARNVRHAAERGALVRVVLPDGTARRIFEITTLDQALPVSESRASAVAELGDA